MVPRLPLSRESALNVQLRMCFRVRPKLPPSGKERCRDASTALHFESGVTYTAAIGQHSNGFRNVDESSGWVHGFLHVSTWEEASQSSALLGGKALGTRGRVRICTFGGALLKFFWGFPGFPSPVLWRDLQDVPCTVPWPFDVVLLVGCFYATTW